MGERMVYVMEEIKASENINKLINSIDGTKTFTGEEVKKLIHYVSEYTKLSCEAKWFQYQMFSSVKLINPDVGEDS